MKTSVLGKLEIATYEGITQRVYRDSVGVLTLGIGSTVTELPNIHTMDKTKEYSIPYCVALFEKSLAKYENAVNAVLKHDIPQHQFDAFVSLFYNVGVGWARRCSSLRGVLDGKSADYVQAHFLAYNQPACIRGRRAKECHLLITGQYSSTGFITHTETDGQGNELRHTAKAIDIRPYFIDTTTQASSGWWWVFWDWFKRH